MNGENVVGMGVSEIRERIVGPIGSEVVVGLESGATGTVYERTLTRGNASAQTGINRRTQCCRVLCTHMTLMRFYPVLRCQRRLCTATQRNWCQRRLSTATQRNCTVSLHGRACPAVSLNERVNPILHPTQNTRIELFRVCVLLAICFSHRSMHTTGAPWIHSRYQWEHCPTTSWC